MEVDEMKMFMLYWRDGTKEVISGNSIQEAWESAGYKKMGIYALDRFEELKGEVEEACTDKTVKLNLELTEEEFSMLINRINMPIYYVKNAYAELGWADGHVEDVSGLWQKIIKEVGRAKVEESLFQMKVEQK